jgi:hypothetical protein
MDISGWTQTSDYESTELGNVTFEQAANSVAAFPWAEHLHKFAERVLRMEAACPPGVGFNSAEKNTFHVYAVAMDEWQLYLRLSLAKKLLGLFTMPAKEFHAEVKTLEDAVELLRLFFDGENDRLATEANMHPSREAVLPHLG